MSFESEAARDNVNCMNSFSVELPHLHKVQPWVSLFTGLWRCLRETKWATSVQKISSNINTETIILTGSNEPHNSASSEYELRNIQPTHRMFSVVLCAIMCCYVLLSAVMFCYVLLCAIMCCYVLLCTIIMCCYLLWVWVTIFTGSDMSEELPLTRLAMLGI